MKQLFFLRGHALIVLLFVALVASLPLGSALEFEVDEGYEVMKALLFERGFSLYSQIWDDQPPLFTVLLAGAFKLGGPSILSARLAVVCFSLLLFLAFYELIRRDLGEIPGLAGTFLLLASPSVLNLSVAVMQEIPTFSVALLSFLFLRVYGTRRTWPWLAASGATMALALQIKFTAVMVGPAMMAEFFLMHRTSPIRIIGKRGASENRWHARLAHLIRNAFIWGIPFITVFVVIAAEWGKGSLQQGWKAHAQGHAVPGMGGPEDCVFSFVLIKDHAATVVFAILGIGLLLRNRRWGSLAFPAILLLTSTVVHAWHRPWWNYYYLHFAVPLAWLAGFAAKSLLTHGSKLFTQQTLCIRSFSTYSSVICLVLAASLLVAAEVRIEKTFKHLNGAKRIESSALLREMKKYASQSRWAYCDMMSNMYAFHARISAPPEIAVITFKRFWSGQITREQIVGVCGEYQSDLLIIRAEPEQIWEPLVSQFYSLVCLENDWSLYVAKRLLGPSDSKPETLQAIEKQTPSP